MGNNEKTSYSQIIELCDFCFSFRVKKLDVRVLQAFFLRRMYYAGYSTTS